MSVIVLYTDLRNSQTILKEAEVHWTQDISAYRVIEKALGQNDSQRIQFDLSNNSPNITVSWSSFITESHSDIGGVPDLGWLVEDESILVITYEDESTTDEQRENSSDWMLKIYERVRPNGS